MKRLLLMASALILVTQANAQNFDDLDDLTPFKYVFGNFNDGETYPIDALGENDEMWWPSASWPTLTADGQFEGFVGISNASGSKKNAAYAAGTSIFDMGGEIGNVLCIKGADCPDDILQGAPKCDLSLSDGAWNCGALMYTFCTSNNPADEKPNVFKLVMKAVYPKGAAEPGWGISTEKDFRIYEHTTGDLTLGTGTGNKGGDGTVVKIGDCGTGDDEWMELVYKYNHGTKVDPVSGKTNAPTQALILNLSPNTLKGMAFVIKEVSFYKDPTFTAEIAETHKRIIKIAGGGSSIHNAMDNSKISYTLNDGKITLVNLKAGAKINVYSLSGMLMKQVKSEGETASFTLDKGYYTINVDGQNIKVLN